VKRLRKRGSSSSKKSETDIPLNTQTPAVRQTAGSPAPVNRAAPPPDPRSIGGDFDAGIFDAEGSVFAGGTELHEPEVAVLDDSQWGKPVVMDTLENSQAGVEPVRPFGGMSAAHSETRAPVDAHDESELDPRGSIDHPVADANGSTSDRQAEGADSPAGASGEQRRPRGRRRSRRRSGNRRDEGAAGDAKVPAPKETAPSDSGWDDEALPAAPELDEDDEAEDDARSQSRSGSGSKASPIEADGRREMLINVADGDEVRIALLRDGRLDELYIERATSVSNVGNIYKGRIVNVEPSIQAAFVDFGLPVHGFLHISDLHPKYFPESKGEPELVGRKTPRRQRPPIQSCLRRGQEVIVQVIKEGVGTKGPTLSSYISLPGRFMVMMPGMDELGVSRKIEDEEQRRKLRDLLGQLSLPKGMGFIARTAGIDRTKRDMQRDLNYLSRLWDKVAARIKQEPAPASLYKESDLVIRTIRDVYDSSLSRIVVDNPVVANRVREFLRIASPKVQDVVEVYENPEPLFRRFGIESEIDKLASREVPLPCGGSLVIESTEALVAIDVNSGRFRVPDSAEETAYRVNLEAVDEIARQLRLRDLGGLIICDFIDMLQEKHRRQIERRLSEAMKKHKERAKLLRISRFGILEMTRQRQRPSFAKSMFQECPRCGGSGRMKAIESVTLEVMRDIKLAGSREGVASIDVRLSPVVAGDVLNRKRHQLTDLERTNSLTIRVQADPNLSVEQKEISCTDRRGREVPLSGVRPLTPPRAAPAAGDQDAGSGERRSGTGSDAPESSGRSGRRRGRRRRGRSSGKTQGS